MDERLDSRAPQGASLFTSSGSSGSDSEKFPAIERVEGYDYEFVQTPDSMYECVICMLVLREPQQTKCGHRFCKACITKWLRESNKTCPVDNSRIVESDLFADNFAKREIQNFKVRCPNKQQGCDKIVILNLIQKHIEDCPFGLVPCPNNCSDILLRMNLNHHLSTVCCYRLIRCQHCSVRVMFNDLPKHQTECPEVVVVCRNCGEKLARKLLQHHENTECSKAEIECMFKPLGCPQIMERKAADEHMTSAITDHLKMLCSEVVQISRHLHLPTGRNYNPNEQDQFSSMQATQVSEELVSYMGTAFSHLNLGQPRSSEQSEVMKAVSVDGSGNIPSAGTDISHESYSSRPATSEGLQGTPGMNLYFEKGYPSISDSDVQSIKKENNVRDEMLARHGRDISDLSEKVKELEKFNRDLRTKVRYLECSVDERDGRSCNGVYFWKIKDYHKLRHEAQIGNMPAIHSPPFYSSYYGYKLCVRVNLNGVDSAKGCFLSIFIHFLKGDFDDLLEWPFTGRIILSVIDQNSACDLRNHIVETLIAKPNLAAFQRPTTTRNHKGFGYMEFVPLGVLDKGHFVKNDTLIIKAHVVPNG